MKITQTHPVQKTLEDFHFKTLHRICRGSIDDDIGGNAVLADALLTAHPKLVKRIKNQTDIDFVTLAKELGYEEVTAILEEHGINDKTPSSRTYPEPITITPKESWRVRG